MVLKITNLHILRYLPAYWLYLLERYTIDNQQCTHTASESCSFVNSIKSTPFLVFVSFCFFKSKKSVDIFSCRQTHFWEQYRNLYIG